MAADDIKPMRPLWIICSRDGSPMAEPPRFALARDLVRHVGEPIVAVIANTVAQAMDAAERVALRYEVLPAVTDAGTARAGGAPQLHPEAPDNICFRFARGDEARVRGTFASAAHVVALELINNRLVGAAIEPRAILALCGPGAAKLTLFTSTQVPHHIRRLVAEQLGIAESSMRVISPDVGGGFGYKGKLYPEEAIMAWAARRLHRPVRWTATRAESFLADNQGRDHVTNAELALDADGQFPCPAREHLRQSRRLCIDIWSGDTERDLYEPACRRLSHPRNLRGKHGRIYQYHADRCVPRRR